MRYFRIPSFSGIEAHRDDANRGSLRIVEGCFPVGTGGMSSGPVWEDVSTVDSSLISKDKNNYVTSKSDVNGNAFVFASRKNAVHDIHVFPEPRTKIGELGPDTVIYQSNGDLDQRKAYFNSIGNRTLLIGEGSTNPIAVGKGGAVFEGDTYEVAPDYSIYGQEWAVFKRCKYFLVGPNKCIFAAGSCLRPLSVWVSEPAGLTTPNRDSPYSNFAISRVDLLMTNATVILGLSLKGTQVIVHTDAGCHLLYSAKGVQASSGYRVEQRPTSVASAAASNAVVNRGYGGSPLWLAQDGHIYKDESASVGQEEQKKNTDKDQATYKSKSAFEHELPEDLSDSFSVYDSATGTYIAFVKSEEYEAWQKAHGQVPDSEDAFVCPADEEKPESDAKIIPEPTPSPSPDPINVQPPEETVIPEEPAEIQDCGSQVEVVNGGFDPHRKKHRLFEEGSTDNPDRHKYAITLQANPVQVPDRFVVKYGGETVIDTGWISYMTSADINMYNELAAKNDPQAEGWDPENKKWLPINGEEVEMRTITFGWSFAIGGEKELHETAEVIVTPHPTNSTTLWQYLLSCPIYLDPENEKTHSGEPEEKPEGNVWDCLVCTDTEDGGCYEQPFIDGKVQPWVLRGMAFYSFIEVTKEKIKCFCEFYNREELIPELNELMDLIHGVNVRVFLPWESSVSNTSTDAGKVTYQYPNFNFNGAYYPASIISNKAGGVTNEEGFLMMAPHTITGRMFVAPMDQFLITLRHEAVHAFQDVEGNMEGNQGLSPVADHGVIYNQHGVDDVATNYSDADPATQVVELEANSAEISRELTLLAHSLIGPKDS